MGEVDWTLYGDMNTASILLSELSEKVLSRSPPPKKSGLQANDMN